MLKLPPRDWYKLNFYCSIRENKAGARFVARNDIGTLIGVSIFPVIIISVLETDIRGL